MRVWLKETENKIKRKIRTETMKNLREMNAVEKVKPGCVE
jgi:hypothetical protein